MTSIREKTRVSAPARKDWPTWLGFAAEEDGRSLDLLVRSLSVIALGWPVLAIARIALVLLFALPALGDVFAAPIGVLALATCTVADGVVIAMARLGRRRATPNRELALLLPFVGATGFLWAMATASLVGEETIGTCMILVACAIVALIGGLRRIVSFVHVIGALMAILLFGAPVGTQTGMVVLLVATGALIHIASSFSLEKVAAGNRTDLFGAQARALLMEFEESGRGWFWETDRAGNISYVSEALARQCGHKAADLVGTPFLTLVGASGSFDGSDGQRSLGFHFSARSAFTNIAVAAESVTSELWWSISGQPVVTSFGQFLGFRGSGSDLTKEKRSQAEIERLAQFDSLTGLANRAQMAATLDQAMATRPGLNSDCALMILDLDRFKEVNDTMGHPVGDALLQQVAQRLLRIVGSEGKVGRLGGDEFQIVLPGQTDRAALSRLGDLIIHTLSQPYSMEGCQAVIGVSIGVALAPGDGEVSDKLIRNADLALYAAKGDGRGTLRFYAASMHADAEDRRQLENDLRRAIATGELNLEYQPVVSSSTERITGFEALLRWDHPERGAISPGVFIPIAEEAGLIGTIGEWVLRTACAEAATWPEDTRIAVNVSPIQFANPNLPALVMNALAASGIAASRLELEITESVFLSDKTNTERVFAALKAIGVRLALDDFGTGYSALGYLKTAPFDKIKIDQSFVRGAAIKGSRNAAIVKSIVNLAEALGMETTAEGAETIDELDLIRALGCSHVQGFIYGQPARSENTLEKLETSGGYAEPQGHRTSREVRLTMLRSVTITHASTRYPARIRNVSPGGAMIEGLTGIPAGAELEVELARGYHVRGICRWAVEDRIGIEFAERVSLERLRTPSEREATPASDVPTFYREDRRGAI